MGEDAQRRRPRVLIAGGGVAALEAALALRDLAGDGLELELCSPCGEFVYRPFGVGDPYAAATVLRYRLGPLAARIEASFRLGGVHAVEPSARQAIARDGERIPYDHLLVAPGARMVWAVPGAVTFWGAADEGGIGGVVRKLRAGGLRDAVFTMPGGHSWVLPAYELALLGSTVLARSGIEDARLAIVTPENAPLELFSRVVREQMTRLLAERGIEVLTGAHPVAFEDGRLRIASGESIETDAVVCLPRLEGRRIEGLPHDERGFLHVDAHGQVLGAEGVFAAGDVTGFPVKQSGIATQEAAAAAAAIAAAAGHLAEPVPFDPELQGGLLEAEGEISGRHLTPFLADLGVGEERLLVSG